MDVKYEALPESEDRIVYVREVDVADLPDEVKSQVGGLKKLYAVHSAEGERLGKDWDLGSMGLSVARDLAQPWTGRVAALCRAYRTDLPDVVAILDLPGEVARARISGRQAGDAPEEMHERTELLETLRQAYLEVGRRLAQQHHVRVHVIDATGDEASLDEAVQALHAD